MRNSLSPEITYIFESTDFGNSVTTGGTYPVMDSNRWKYNGKEVQTTGNVNWLDYGAREYDEVIGRWTRPDPMSEKYYGTSGYTFCSDNPENRFDNTGTEDDWVKNLKLGKYEWMDNVTSASNTPSGYTYVGHENTDILNSLKIPKKYATKYKSGNKGVVIASNENNSAGALIFVQSDVQASVSVDVNVSYNHDNSTSNNAYGCKFEGVTFSASVSQSSYSGDMILAENAKYKGSLNVFINGKNKQSMFGKPTGSYFSEQGTSLSVASISVSATELKPNDFSRYANIKLGAPNSEAIKQLNKINMSWPLVYIK